MQPFQPLSWRSAAAIVFLLLPAHTLAQHKDAMPSTPQIGRAQAARAQSAVLFAREDIVIEPAAPPPAREGEAVIVRHPVPLNVEVRTAEALRLEYIHTLNTLTAGTGVMIILPAPSAAALPYMKVPTPVDAVLIMEDGTITQIVPHVLLSDVAQVVVAREPIQAFLFLKDGQAAAHRIRPRDMVTGSMFPKTAAPVR